MFVNEKGASSRELMLFVVHGLRLLCCVAGLGLTGNIAA